MSTKWKFEYEWKDTALHRMHPLAKIALIISLGGITSAWMDFRYSLVVLVIAIFFWYMAKCPSKWIRIPLLFVLGSQWSSLILKIPFQNLPGLYKVLPEEYALTPLLDLGQVPFIGHMVYNYGSAWIFMNDLVKYFTLVSLSVVLYYSTSISDIVQVFISLRIPNIIVFPFMAVFRFFPVMTRLSSDVKNAQILRGAKLSSWNPVTFVRRLLPLMYPIGRQFVRTNLIVTLSIVNRAFNANPMRIHKHLRMTIVDKVVTIICPIIFVAFLYLAITPPYYLGNI